MICKCLESKLKEWVILFFPNIEKEEVNKFIYEVLAYTNIYINGLDKYECHKHSKKNGYDRLCIDIKRISTTIDSISTNPILDYEQRQNLISQLEKFKEQLVKTSKERYFERSIFYRIYEDNKQNSQVKLLATGETNSILIRNEFINSLEVVFKKYTGSKTRERTEIQKKNNSKSPFLALVVLLYNYIGIKKEKDSVQKDINRANK